MGVRFNRSVLVARGKRVEASKFAGDVCKYLGELTGTEVVWGVEVGNTVGKIHWFADYENLAALEAAFDDASKDEGYNKLLDSSTDLFVGQPQDTWVYTM
jgi:hypothetical protein